MLKRLMLGTLLSAVVIAAAMPARVQAIDVTTQPPIDPAPAPSSLIVTDFYLTGPKLHHVQLFNNSDAPLNVDGIKVALELGGPLSELALADLSGWVMPRDYIVIGEVSFVTGADYQYQLTIPDGSLQVASSINVIRQELTEKTQLPLPSGEDSQRLKRRKTANDRYAVGTQTDFILADESSPLYGGGWYEFPSAFSLKVLEILPNARNCSPLEEALDCGDYIKVFNPTNQPVMLDDFRIRNGYRGQNATASNTFTLSGQVLPGEHFTIISDASGRDIGLTTGGNHLWFEDVYGVHMYEESVMEYPSASSASLKGKSWAYNNELDEWQWGTPSPEYAYNVFPEPEVVVAKAANALKPCNENQYRHPETNRCRLIASASSQLTPCRPGQERNPETNRCRSVNSGSTTHLTPCRPGQERNPETNRCRSVAGASTSSLTPCGPGQERNPETNRCRLIREMPTVAYGVEEVQEEIGAYMGWWAVVGAGVLAVGYGVWEWRHEIAHLARKAMGIFSAIGKP